MKEVAMRLSLGHIDEYDERVATFARQLGLTGVQFHTPNLLPGAHGYWSLEELRALRARCDADRLNIDGLENVPLAHFWKVQRGLPGRDEQIENHRITLRTMAAATFDLRGYNFLPTFVWRTDMAPAGPRRAAAAAFHLSGPSPATPSPPP